MSCSMIFWTRHFIISSLLGAGIGAAGVNIAKNASQNAILNNPNNKELLEQYYKDYIEDVPGKISEYRKLKSGIKGNVTTQIEYDKIYYKL